MNDIAKRTWLDDADFVGLQSLHPFVTDIHSLGTPFPFSLSATYSNGGHVWRTTAENRDCRLGSLSVTVSFLFLGAGLRWAHRAW